MAHPPSHGASCNVAAPASGLQPLAPPPPPPLISCFRGLVNVSRGPRDPSASSPPRTRAKLTAEEKTKVLDVRRQGACLRCRMLKIECSVENPCQPCLRSAQRGAERKVLSFCYCVRTRFSDVNIFASADPEGTGTGTMRIDDMMGRVSGLLDRIAAPASFLLKSSPEVFNQTLVSWLTDPKFNFPNGSVVGLCCSNLLSLQFHDGPDGMDELVTDFRRFLLATSMSHNGWHQGEGSLGRQELGTVGRVSGYRLIKKLDRILTRQFLAKCDRGSCQVLFLLVLGAVLGVGYASGRQHHEFSPPFPSQGQPSTANGVREGTSAGGPDFRRSPTLWLAMREHLCQMLAHHLIFVGSMLGIKLETGLEQRIIDTAADRWNKAESYYWADGAGFQQQRQQQQQWRPRQRPPTFLPRTRELNMAFEKEEVPRLASWRDSTGHAPIPTPPPLPPPLVAIPLPEVQKFPVKEEYSWDDNPQSYLDMEDIPESGGDSEATSSDRAQLDRKISFASPELAESPVSPDFPYQQAPRHRSMWVVRGFDAGPEHGYVNVQTRLRVGRDMDDIRGFV